MKTRVTEILGTEYPVIQGGMAWVAEYRLAAAVSEAGGFGIIGAGGAPAQFVRDQIRKCRELTKKPFGVNIMLMNPEADEIARVAAEEGVKAVTTGAGNPGKYMAMWKEAGIRVIPVVASVALARMMERAGADAVVAEGMEAGGHIGSSTTFTLVPQVADAVLQYESEVIRLVNQVRAENGLKALSPNWELSRVARYKSEDMARNGYFSHTSPTYGTPFQMIRAFGLSFRSAGENIAYGQRTPAAVVDAWMNSSGHRANILNASYTQIGVGYCADGRYWTQMFIG